MKIITRWFRKLRRRKGMFFELKVLFVDPVRLPLFLFHENYPEEIVLPVPHVWSIRHDVFNPVRPPHNPSHAFSLNNQIVRRIRGNNKQQATIDMEYESNLRLWNIRFVPPVHYFWGNILMTAWGATRNSVAFGIMHVSQCHQTLLSKDI